MAKKLDISHAILLKEAYFPKSMSHIKLGLKCMKQMINEKPKKFAEKKDWNSNGWENGSKSLDWSQQLKDPMRSLTILTGLIKCISIMAIQESEVAGLIIF